MKRKIFCIVAAVLSLFMSFYFTGCVDNSNKNPIVTIEIDPNTGLVRISDLQLHAS